MADYYLGFGSGKYTIVCRQFKTQAPENALISRNDRRWFLGGGTAGLHFPG